MEDQLFKDFQLELKDIDGKKGIVSGYFTDFESLDSDGDIIKKGAFARTINDNGPASVRPRIKHLFNHNVDQPLGVLLTLKEDQKGLMYESKIGTHALGQDFIKMAESGLITEHSIGYRTIRKNTLTEDYKEGQPMRELLELRLYEGSSLSAWGANPNTPLLGVKSLEKAIERSQLIEKFCRDTDATDETIQALLEYNKDLLQIIATKQPAPAIVPEQEIVEAKKTNIFLTEKPKKMADNEKTLQAQLSDLREALKGDLLTANKEQLDGLVLQVETVNSKINAMATKNDIAIMPQLKAQIDEINEALKKNQPVIDDFIAGENKKKNDKKDFGTTWSETIGRELESKKAEIEEFTKNKNGRIILDLKVGTMAIANVTGDTVASYNNRQGLVPNQKVNIRDLIPTTSSPTGLFVTYRETGTSGAIGVQTEGSSKSQIDYSFTEIKTVSKYIAGYARFTKQLMFALPWLQTTLPRMLLRDFYKKENDYIYSAMQTAATGDAGTTGAANTAEQAIQLIANQRNADFNSSYILTDWLTWARIMATKGTTEYGVPGGVTIDNLGNVRLAGVPVVGASFADPGAMTLWDNDQVERVETETLRVEFSFEDQDNFIKNLVTAKVECFEELNVLRPDAIIDTTTS